VDDVVRVTGADDLERLGRQLKDIGDKELRRDLLRGIQRATRPLKDDIKDSARRNLPRRGGLNEWVANQGKVSTRTSTAGRNVGVRVVADKKGSDLAAINRGRLRHPVFGNRKVWVTQLVPPGWFDQGTEDGAVRTQRELVEVFDDIAERLERG
jgi:hypothetical protein